MSIIAHRGDRPTSLLSLLLLFEQEGGRMLHGKKWNRRIMGEGIVGNCSRFSTREEHRKSHFMA
jgi:hypothetical protein